MKCVKIPHIITWVCVMYALSHEFRQETTKNKSEYHLCVSVSQQEGNNTSPSGKMNQKLYILLLHHIDTSFSDVLWRKIVTIYTQRQRLFLFIWSSSGVCVLVLRREIPNRHTRKHNFLLFNSVFLCYSYVYTTSDTHEMSFHSFTAQTSSIRKDSVNNNNNNNKCILYTSVCIKYT